MNIAFGALLILLLLFPGIIFRISYLEGPYSRRIIQSSLVDELILSLVPAFVLQFLGYLLIEKLPLFSYEVDEKTLYSLLTGQPGINFSAIERGIPRFVAYQFVAFAASFGLGKALRVFVLRRGLDLRYHSLSVFNDWYYLLKGKLAGEVNLPVVAVYVDALVETKEGSYLYSGLIEDFFLSRENGLDRIYFKKVYRRKLGDDLKAASEEEMPSPRWLDERYYEMPGEFFVIPYTQIKNMNVRYFYLVEKSNAEEQTSTSDDSA